ncbi:MAG: universal stress protein [Verrucomicrobia bacterium]|nr:universal stress protein [Verrucomicrobiota bacterium]MBI3867840.1 universal stress protein [Verrucomicrobiota bacterium]
MPALTSGSNAANPSASQRSAKRKGLGVSTILLPVDFSPASRQALDEGVRFARMFRARLILLYVLEPIPMPDFANAFPLVMENETVMKSCKKRLEQLATKAGVSPRLIERTLVREGQPYIEITDAARTLRADLIIIPTHGYTGLKHAFLGSTAERVVRHATCPVLVIRSRNKA